MSRDIRIGFGDISAYNLLTTSSYLVTNWPLQTGQTASIPWRASQPEQGEMRRQFRPSLSVGSGSWVGLYSGIIEIWAMNGAMREYFNETILNNSPIAQVTAYLHSIEHNEFEVFTGELVTPHALNAESEYQRFSDSLYYGNRYIFRRATRKTILLLGTEAGLAIADESNIPLALEQQT